MEMRARFEGCLLGHMAGDALGAPFEGMPSAWILGQFGGASRIVQDPPVERLCYTDDTQMMVALGEALCEHGCVEEEALMEAFAEAYDPARGYGTGMRRLLAAAKAKEDWRTEAENLFPGGSYGNGGAMRVSPVGLLFHEDLNRVWAEAGKSAAVTHRHPLGIEGAQLMAVAVALAARGEAIERAQFFRQLRGRAVQEEYQWLLKVAANLTARDSLGQLGSSLEAHRSVVTAIACFAVSPESWGGAVARALALGDDVDTVMAMTGAISGAHLGIEGVPAHVLERVENEGKGREYARELAGRLWEKSVALRRR